MALAEAAPQLIGSSGDSLREAFGIALAGLAETYPDVVVLDADIAGGTGAHHFRKAYPTRFLQFGIAEQNMMAAAAGLAAVGLIPVVTTFAVFCLRAIEQARLSVAYAKRNVKIVASHPGLDVGPDGGSAQALEDLAAFRAVPGMTVISPADPLEMALAVKAMLDFDGPIYMRTGRSPAKRVFSDGHTFEIGKGQILRFGSDVTLVACGVEVARALQAADMLAREKIAARVVNMPTIKPIDAALLAACAEETGAIVTAEDHNIYGGLGGAVAEALARTYPAPIEFVGLNDRFGESGEPEELADHCGIGASAIADAARCVIKRKARA
ncbi:MAG TPA: transketolase C-terminal domain-containing protein [Micropepsaceae bacterium]|nr:transketolase C-terminal domain-containing protein [Micropepsaceae bacterium]